VWSRYLGSRHWLTPDHRGCWEGREEGVFTISNMRYEVVSCVCMSVGSLGAGNRHIVKSGLVVVARLTSQGGWPERHKQLRKSS